MKSKGIVVMLLAVCAMLPAASFAQATDCGELCKRYSDIAKLPSDALVVNANTGKRQGGLSSYPDGSDVHVYVVEMNPYRYSYDIKVERQDANVDRVSAFLTAFGLDVSAIIGSTLGGTLRPTGGQEALADECSNESAEVKAAIKALADASKDLLKEGKDLKDKLSAEASKQKAVRDAHEQFIKDTAKPDVIKDTASCEKICASANDLRSKIEAYKPAASLAATATAFKKKVDDGFPKIEAAIKALKDLIAAGKITNANCKEFTEADMESAGAVKGDADKYVKAADEIDKTVKALKDIAKIIDEVHVSKTAFVYDNFVAGEPGAKTIITTVKRDVRGGNDPQTVVTRVDVGKPFMSISGGFGFSTVEDVTVTRVRGASADGKAVVEKFGEENNSSLRPSAVAMLNGRMFDFGQEKNPMTFSWSVGMVITPSSGTTSTEYITGPTFGFRDNAILFSLGYHVARVKHLGGGFEVGKEIPSTLTGDLPTESDWEGGAMFAVTFKLR